MFGIMKVKNRFTYSFLLGLSIAVLLAGCTSTPMMPGRPSPVVSSGYAPIPSAYSSAPLQTIYHEVGPMETLWRIAKEYDVSIQSLMEANRIKDPSKISAGQKLKIPQTRGIRPVIPLYQTNKWSYIVIHHTATDMGNASLINKAHHQRGFWDGLGYHFLIDNGTLGKLDGQIEISPRWIKQKDGAHCNAAGMNQKGIGIALVGNFSQDRVSGQQLDSLVFLVKTLMQYYRIPVQNVLGHRNVPGKQTECPGKYFPWNEFISRLRQTAR